MSGSSSSSSRLRPGSEPQPLAMPPYVPRLTRGLGTRERSGWTIKLIGISAGDVLPAEPDLTAAVDAAEQHLPPVGGRHGMAFLIVHAGTEALWGILGWWELDIVYLRTLRADLGSTAFTRVPPEGPTACAWELEAINHERQAWTAHVLARPTAPDYTSYAATQIS